MDETKSIYQPNEMEFEASRKASDEKLLEGGAETVQGKLQITDEQYNHLHKQMEAELAANTEAKKDIVGYVKDHIESDLSFQPQIRQEVAKVLDTLLKLSNTNDRDFAIKPIFLLAQLEQDPRIKKLTNRGFVILHESKKAAMQFTKLDDKQKGEIEEYIQGMLEKEASTTLEQYMTKQLGLESKKSYDPNDVSSDEDKMMVSALAVMNAGNMEDFTLRVPDGQEKSTDEIVSLVSAYYKDRGYNLKDQFYGTDLLVEKDGRELYITISNYSEFLNTIMVSVTEFNIPDADQF